MQSASVNVGELLVTIRKGEQTPLAVPGRKAVAAMRRRKRQAGVETASEGMCAIRDGR